MSTTPAPAPRFVPAARDPRWGQVAVLTSFTVAGQTFLHFDVSLAEIATALGVAVVLDAVLLRRRSGHWSLPLSAAISGLSVGLLLRSPDPAVFALASAAAMGSKHFIRTREGRHVFNPSAFGIVLALAFSSGLSEVTPGQWGTSALVALAACAAGAMVVFRVRRLAMVGVFLLAHLAAAVAVTGGIPPASEAFGASVLVFAFFMLTDPRTGPARFPAQVAYAAGVAGLSQLLMAAGSMAAPFLALVALCAAVPALDRLAARRAVPAPAIAS